MSTLSRRRFLALGTLALAATARPSIAFAQAFAKTRALFQVSDDDPRKWALTLGSVFNALDTLGKDTTELEVVVYGPGIDMLRKGSNVAPKVADALKAGVRIMACQSTMHARELGPGDMLPDIGFVSSGVVEIMKREEAGWAYLRS